MVAQSKEIVYAKQQLPDVEEPVPPYQVAGLAGLTAGDGWRGHRFPALRWKEVLEDFDTSISYLLRRHDT